jgi:putative tricarboxylic transport membrane protein
MSASDTAARRRQALIGAGALVLGGLMAWGATGISSEAGYGGVGPDFLPWLVALALAACGAGLVWRAARGGWRAMDEPSGAPQGDWRALAWVLGGLAAGALLLERAGFVLACTTCFVLAVRGLRASEGRPHGGARGLVLDAVTGMLIATPAYWLFTKLLGISLPGLTSSGWL